MTAMDLLSNHEGFLSNRQKIGQNDSNFQFSLYLISLTNIFLLIKPNIKNITRFDQVDCQKIGQNDSNFCFLIFDFYNNKNFAKEINYQKITKFDQVD